MNEMDKRICAKKVSIKEVLKDMYNDLKSKRVFYIIILTIGICLVLVLSLFNLNINDDSQLNVINHSMAFNIGFLGIDVAALAILSAMFHGITMEGSAEEAFREQKISFIFNGFIQMLGIMGSTACVIWNTNVLFNIVIGIQFIAILTVFDLLIELYTIIYTLKNK